MNTNRRGFLKGLAAGGMAMATADENSKYAETLKLLNVEVLKNEDGTMNFTETMKSLFLELGEIDDQTQRLAIAYSFFGKTAVDVNKDGWDEYYGYGLIDAYAALNYYSGNPPPNQAPTADFTYTTSLLEVTFTDESSDSDGSIASWSWDFGDGIGTSELQNPSYTYTAAGIYTVH